MVNQRFTPFDWFIYVSLAIVGLMAVVPFLYIVSVSITPYGEVLRNGGFILIPRSITFEAYNQLFSRPLIPRSISVTLFLASVGTFLNLLLTVLMAYPLSRKKLPGRKVFLLFIVFTMLFNGGIIPTFLIVKATGLLNSVWAMIIPNLIWVFNILIMKTFMEALPEELLESAKMDGASETRIMRQLVIPLSIPSIITIGLFYLVGQWNQFFAAIMYIQDPNLYPLQVVVRSILISAQNLDNNIDATLPTATLQMASVVVASAPIILIYPFLQSYLTKGMLLGSIKG